MSQILSVFGMVLVPARVGHRVTVVDLEVALLTTDARSDAVTPQPKFGWFRCMTIGRFSRFGLRLDRFHVLLE
jgi:hypothetical protein